MVALQIRDVSTEVRDALATRARSRGQSLQAFLLELVNREAGLARNQALLSDLSWSDGSRAVLVDVIDALDKARTERSPA